MRPLSLWHCANCCAVRRLTDGYEATAALRAQGVPIPIVALTGNALDEDQRKFIQAGANEVLTKPVRRENIEDTLRHYTSFGNALQEP